MSLCRAFITELMSSGKWQKIAYTSKPAYAIDNPTLGSDEWCLINILEMNSLLLVGLCTRQPQNDRLRHTWWG